MRSIPELVGAVILVAACTHSSERAGVVVARTVPACSVPVGYELTPIAAGYIDRLGANQRRIIAVGQLPFSRNLSPDPQPGSIMLRSTDAVWDDLRACYGGWLDVITLPDDAGGQLCVTVTLHSEGRLPMLDSPFATSMSGGCDDGGCSVSACGELRDASDARIVVSGVVRHDETAASYRIEVFAP